MTIRRTPQDFVVEERLTEAFRAQIREQLNGARPDAAHLVFELTKTSLTTPEATQFFAKALGVRPGLGSYAGLKDKHAHTVQHVTVPGGALRPQAHAAAGYAGPRELAGKNWTARWVGWSAVPAEAPIIEGNRFTIVVRDLSAQASAEMDRRARVLMEARGESRGLLIVNYFGDQRFGSARHGQGFIAPHLIRGEFEQALKLSIATPSRKDSGRTREFTRLAATEWGGKWKELAAKLPRCPERRAIECLAAGEDFREAFAALPYFFQQLCVEAYQSHLWNALARRLARRIADGAGESPERGEATPGACLSTDDPFGQMLFPAASSVGAEWRNLELPLLSRKTELAATWRDEAMAVFAEDGLAQDQLRIPGMRRPWFGEAMRPLFATAAGFAMSKDEPDELSKGGKRLKRTLSFDLPRGAYATVVLRGLGQ